MKMVRRNDIRRGGPDESRLPEGVEFRANACNSMRPFDSMPFVRSTKENP
jgi:hypothetical protein